MADRLPIIEIASLILGTAIVLYAMFRFDTIGIQTRNFGADVSIALRKRGGEKDEKETDDV